MHNRLPKRCLTKEESFITALPDREAPLEGEISRQNILRHPVASRVTLENRRPDRKLSRHKEVDGPRQAQQRHQPLL